MEQLVEQLKVILGTAFSFALKAQYYHWNVSGPNFSERHSFFGEIYEKVQDDLDLYGEHIRALGAFAPGSINRINELTRIRDEDTVPNDLEMIIRLESDNRTMLLELNAAAQVAEAAGARGTLNFLEGQIEYHEKLGWMLRSHFRSM